MNIPCTKAAAQLLSTTWETRSTSQTGLSSFSSLVSALLVAYDFPVFALAVLPLAFAQNTTVSLATASGGPGEKLFIIVGDSLGVAAHGATAGLWLLWAWFLMWGAIWGLVLVQIHNFLEFAVN
jgi:hypothetical protein